MRSTLMRAAAALAALLLLAALLGGCGGGTQPALVTPAPKTDAPPSPTPGRPDAPEPTPEVPETPEARPAALAYAVGSWELYSSEVEGDLNYAADTGSRDWLIVRDCARADFVESLGEDGRLEHLNCPIRTGADGLILELPEDEYGRTFEIVRADAQELELSVSFLYSDGTTGGSTLVFRRLQEPGTAFNGEAVSARELRALNERANTLSENGFFQCSFARPQEIDWIDVFYNGAGIDCEPDETALAEYADADDGFYDYDFPVFCIADAALRAFVWDRTLTSYSEAETQLRSDWYESSDGYYLAQHGDTSFVPVELTAAYADGELYQLHYEQVDYVNFVFDPIPFVMTVRIHDGAWQYVSNLRADAPAPTLLTVDYFSEDEDLPECFNLTDSVEPEVLPSDEPSRVWAVLTAREDGVRYRVDRADLSYDDADYFLTLHLARSIGDNVCSGVLNAGESVAVKVNLPWYPVFRVTAAKDTLYGETWCGEQNMLHIFDIGARSYVVGRDADAEGRGCAPQSELELMAFLCDGDWFWLDPDTLAPKMLLSFSGGHNATLESGGQYYDLIPMYAWSGEAAGAPDVIRLCRGYDEYADWSALPGAPQPEDYIGDYSWRACQLDGEQLLFLTQFGGEPGALRYLLPGAAQDETEFLFLRFNGTMPEEAQG